MICPNCKFEYVEGIKICPDCKIDLVDELAEEEIIEEVVETSPSSFEDLSDEEKAEMYDRYRRMTDNPVYKNKAEQLSENKSGAVVLLLSGFAGLIVLLLNAIHVINLPLNGFSLYLMDAVMGCLFFVFVVTGFMSVGKIKKLKPEVAAEEEAIEKVLAFVKAKKESGEYKLNSDSEAFEALYLELSDKVVDDIKAEFPDLEPGFAFYIVDRFAGDILDEN